MTYGGTDHNYCNATIIEGAVLTHTTGGIQRSTLTSIAENESVSLPPFIEQ